MLYWKMQNVWSWIQWRVSTLVGRIRVTYVDPFFMALLHVRREDIKPAHRSRKLRNYYHEVVSMHGPFKRAWLWHIRRWLL
jgi:hypothetical protein